MRTPIPRISTDTRFLKKDIGRALDANDFEQGRAQRGLMFFGAGEAERAHAASLSAVSIRRNMVQMPSMPGRHCS